MHERTHITASSLDAYLSIHARKRTESERISEKLSEQTVATIVIPAYQEAKTIQQTLISLNQQNSSRFEVIVVDNASTDATKDKVREFKSNHARYPLYLLEEELPGPGHARKTGMDETVRRIQARGTHIEHVLLTTDADTTFPPNWLEQVTKVINKGWGAFGGPHSAREWIDKRIWEHLGLPNYFKTISNLNRFLASNNIGKVKLSGPNAGFHVNAYVKTAGMQQPTENNHIGLKEISNLAQQVNDAGYPIGFLDSTVYSNRRRHLMELIKNRPMYFGNSHTNPTRFLTIRGDERVLLDYAIKSIPPNDWLSYQQSLIKKIVENMITKPYARGEIDISAVWQALDNKSMHESSSDYLQASTVKWTLQNILNK